MAVRGARVAASAGVTAGNGAINAVRREAYLALEPTRGQDISFPFELTKRGWRAVYEPAAVAASRWPPTVGAEFGRKRRMMRRRLGDDAAPRDAVAARIPARCTRSRSLSHRAPALRVAAAAPRRPRGQRRAARRGPVYAVTLGAAARAARGRGPAGPPCPLRPLQIARYYVARHRGERRRALGLPAPRRPADVGEGGGDAMSRGRAATCRRRRGSRRPRGLAIAAPAPRRGDRDQARLARAGDLPARRVGADGEEFDLLQAADDDAGRRPGRGRDAGARGRPARHAGRRAAAALLARRAAQPRQRAARRDGDRRPAPDPRGAGRGLHAAPAPAARGQAGDHRLGAGQRPRGDPVGRADRARRLVRGPPLAAASTCGSSARTARLLVTGRGLYG